MPRKNIPNDDIPRDYIGEPSSILSFGLFLICLPLGFAVWIVPFYYAEEIGLYGAMGIIALFFVILISISLILSPKEETKPDSQNT